MNTSTLPLVSIGVPTYNRPKTLKRALDSLINQTYRNIEIIVSDNCSTNSEVEQLMQLFTPDSRIKYIRQPENLGLINNFNFLVTRSTGDYFMWLADDDWLDSNYVEECLKFLLSNPGYSAAYGLGKVYSQTEEFINYDLQIDLEQHSGSERIRYFLQEVITNGCFSALVPAAYKSELLMTDVIAADWIVVSRIALLGKYKMLETTNTHIAQGGMSSTTEGLTKNMSVFTRSFPYLTIALNLSNDILFGSKVYNKLNFLDRIVLAKECFLIVYNRHHVKYEIQPGIKKLISFNKTKIKSCASKIRNVLRIKSHLNRQ